MEDIRNLLLQLISCTKNTKRRILYENHYNNLNTLKFYDENEMLTNVYRNISGLVRFAEIDKSEYDMLKLLLNMIDQITK